MNYGLLLKISLILTIIITLCMGAIKPQMHKTIVAYNSEYEVTNPAVVEKEEKNIPTVTQTEKKKIDVKREEINTEEKSFNKVNEETSTNKTQAKPQTSVAKQEEIEWNRWRSNLQNQILKEVRLPKLPKGTLFRFTFDVDEYGKITNIQTWSEDKNYTPYAIQYIAPVIRSMQGRSLLTFPKGTERTNVKAIGGFRISNVSRYSSPRDYDDTEVIKK